jgi:hypothetical protein
MRIAQQVDKAAPSKRCERGGYERGRYERGSQRERGARSTASYEKTSDFVWTARAIKISKV